MIHKTVLIMLAAGAMGAVSSMADAAGGAVTLRCVAAKAYGPGDGTVPTAAADYLDGVFWQSVNALLDQGPVTVRFAPGAYASGALRLEGIGHAEHLLTLQGDPAGRTRFELRSEEGKAPNTGLFFKDCQRIAARALCFTGSGHAGYISQVQGQHILFEDCRWTELPNIRFGATGTSGAATHHVTWRRCAFERIGSHGGAHMIYNAYGPQHIYAEQCRFEDCAGDYIRWRDRTDYAVAADCRFVSTGTWPRNKPVHAAFIGVPVFPDKIPGDEWFGTHFLICDNAFTYAQDRLEGAAPVLYIRHHGVDPPDRRHLLTPDEGRILEQGDPDACKELLASHCGIELDEIRMFNNVFDNAPVKAAFESTAAYGGKSKGWNGRADITRALNFEPRWPEWAPEGLGALGPHE